MYIPAAFSRDDRADVQRILDEYPFGILIVGSAETIQIAHVPFYLDRNEGDWGTLHFHVARANPILKPLEDGEPAIVVFNGPDGYISASWYEKPSEQVPTWNYIAIHAFGRPRSATRTELSTLLAALAIRHEPAANGRWNASQLEASFRDGLLDAIAGFVLPIDRVEPKFKLSQNRSPADRKRVRTGLLRRGGENDVSLTEWMALLESE